MQDDSEPAENIPGGWHAEFEHQSATARVPEDVAPGLFANAAIVLGGPHEFVIDFLIRLGPPERVVARLILPPLVAEQFVNVLRQSLANFENQFGRLPTVVNDGAPPRDPAGTTAARSSGGDSASDTGAESSAGSATGPSETVSAHETTRPEGRHPPPIDQIYGELKLPEELLPGRYANAVLLRHSATEFCFDFVNTLFPKSIVTARIFMAAPHVPALCQSLAQSCSQSRRRNPPPGQN